LCEITFLFWVPVTTAFHILRLQKEERASRHGEKLQIYWINSCR